MKWFGRDTDSEPTVDLEEVRATTVELQRVAREMRVELLPRLADTLKRLAAEDAE